MANIHIIDSIRLNHKGLFTLDENSKWVEVHKQQGDLDGACAIYSLVMAMLCNGLLSDDDTKAQGFLFRLVMEWFSRLFLCRAKRVLYQQPLPFAVGALFGLRAYLRSGFDDLLQACACIRVFRSFS